jgi:predicted flap endonuclease-1-like 5' DNA nuclease
VPDATAGGVLMSDPIVSIKGVTADLAAKFKGLGIADSDALLGRSRTPADRRELAGKVGVDASALTEFANRADLARVKGVAGVYADLLEQAGVDTVKELARRVPANLHAKLAEVNAAKKLTSRLPTAEMVAEWVTQAKTLPPALEY